MAVHVECLCRPEHEDREEVRARDEGDDEGQAENTRLLAQSLGEHGVLCVSLPDDEGDEEDCA